jgi:predicted esterase
MPADDGVQLRLIPATVHGRVLVRPPATQGPHRWLVGFHGYAQNAQVFLDLLRQVPGSERWLLVAVQALHPFYYGRTQEVVANWMTRQDRELAIADNIAYVDAVVVGLEREFGPAAALVYAGFSQGVAMAFRAGVAGRHACDAVLAAGGDLPPELRAMTGGRWPRIVLCTGTEDDWHTPARLEDDAAFLRSRSVRTEAIVFEGGHEWSAGVLAAAGRLLADLEQGQPQRRAAEPAALRRTTGREE